MKAGTAISIHIRYLPVPNAIDTYYATTRSINVNVTSLYFANTGPGFTLATFDSCRSTSDAPRITNTANKNKGGINGVYSSDAAGVINRET